MMRLMTCACAGQKGDRSPAERSSRSAGHARSAPPRAGLLVDHSPVLPPSRHGSSERLRRHFQADTGTINQLVHLWKFDDDADRRAHWAAVYANKDFAEGFAVKFRPLVASQEVKLLTAAPWGPHP